MTIDLVTLGFFSFCGGLIDAAVGGGGLVLIPALIHALPDHALAAVFGTNKVAVWAGTCSSLFRFAKHVRIVWRIMLPTALSACLCAYIGASSVAHVPKASMEILVFIMLIAMAIYTFVKKDLGQIHRQSNARLKDILKGVFFGGLIGFYDGVFGPGSGSFLIFLFVRGFGFDFLNASASAKLVNLGTFTAALTFFVPNGNVLWSTGMFVAACNILGALVGVFLALRFGSQFIRIGFLTLLTFLIGRMGLGILTMHFP